MSIISCTWRISVTSELARSKQGKKSLKGDKWKTDVAVFHKVRSAAASLLWNKGEYNYCCFTFISH